MAVVTISREFGSRAAQIAQGLSEATGWPLVDKQTLIKLLSEYGMVDFDEFYEADYGFFDRFSKSNTTYVHMLNQAIQAFARQDNVIILGRGGFAVLQDYRNVLNVLIKAPLDFRIRSLMQSEDISTETAEAILSQNDKARASFLQTFYGVSIADSSGFDLVIDSSKLPAEMATRWISEATDYLDIFAQDDDKHTGTIAESPVLDEAVRAILKR